MPGRRILAGMSARMSRDSTDIRAGPDQAFDLADHGFVAAAGG